MGCGVRLYTFYLEKMGAPVHPNSGRLGALSRSPGSLLNDFLLESWLAQPSGPSFIVVVTSRLPHGTCSALLPVEQVTVEVILHP